MTEDSSQGAPERRPRPPVERVERSLEGPGDFPEPSSEPPAAEPELPADAEPAAPPPPPAGAATPSQSRRLVVPIVIAVTGLLLLVACLVGGALLISAARDEIPVVGDCMSHAADPNQMEPVECGEPGADWTVIGVHGTLTRSEFEQLSPENSVCAEHPNTEQALWVTDAWRVDDSTEGQVVCLARAKT